MIEGNVLHVYSREAVSIALYTLNRVNIKGDTGKTPYELWFGHAPTIRYFRIFDLVNVISKEMKILDSLMLDVMKEFFLVILL